MSTILVLPEDDLQSVEVLWSNKYGCPVYKVADQMYIEDTGEYAGYFDEVSIKDK